MTADEIMACVREGVAFGYGTAVLQAGEDPGIGADWMADVVRRIKAESPLAVTLSLGERERDELALWREAGADRYLLRFETSNRQLFERIHPPRPGRVSDRIALLGMLREVGLRSGQRRDDRHSRPELRRPGRRPGTVPRVESRHDRRRPVPHAPRDAAGRPRSSSRPRRRASRCRSSELMTYKVIALTRLLCPRANIPSTTALATLNKQQRPRVGPGPRGEHRDAQPHAAQVSHPLRDLSEQGLHPGIGRHVPPLHG